MRGLRLFIRPIEAGDREVVDQFLATNGADRAVPACGLLGKLLGSVVAVVAMEITPDAVRVDDIVVDRELRRKRIGRAMLREVEQLAVKMERTRVVVIDARGAQEFLRRVGFVSEGDQWTRWVG